MALPDYRETPTLEAALATAIHERSHPAVDDCTLGHGTLINGEPPPWRGRKHCDLLAEDYIATDAMQQWLRANDEALVAMSGHCSEAGCSTAQDHAAAIAAARERLR